MDCKVPKCREEGLRILIRCRGRGVGVLGIFVTKLSYFYGIGEGLATGLGFGTLFSFVFYSYALVVWFDAKMILEKGYTGGDVLNDIVAVLTRSMSLGQAFPCLSAFAAGRTAAYKMFETINRKPEIDAYDT